MASVARKNASTRHDKEIDSVLSRLHSGSRFVYYNKHVKRGSGAKPSDEYRAYNVLRNLTHPDEVHADLGRALANSYVSSLCELSSLLSYSNDLKTEDDAAVKAAIDRGMFILQSLVCGEDVSKHENKEVIDENRNKASYAAAAYSFFDQLVRSMFFKDDVVHIRVCNTERAEMRSFVNQQWQQWCIRCEELVYMNEKSSFTGGGGIHVLNACMKGYATFCFGLIGPDESGEGPLSNNYTCCSGTVYHSLKQTVSRKFWIRACVCNAMEIVNSKKIECDTLIVDCLSPLFHACVLQARHESPQQQQDLETFQHKHIERQLLLRDIFGVCSSLLHGVKDESAFNQIAHVVKYLSTSLSSYIDQVSTWMKSKQITNDSSIIDIADFLYDWLRGISDIMRLMVSRQYEESNIVVDAVSSSLETILRHLLPQITSHLNIGLVSFDMSSVYSTLHKAVSFLPRFKLVQMADPLLAFRLGTLTLNLQDEQELKILCNLIISIFSCLEPDGNSERIIEVMPSSSDLLWIGGILCSLGCTFLPLKSINAKKLKNLGGSILGNVHSTLQSGGTKSNTVSIGDDCSLLEILSQSLHSRSNSSSEIQFLISIMSSSVSNLDEKSVLLYTWKRRPLSVSEQHSALLIGLSLLQISLRSVASIGEVQTDDAFAFLRSLMECHPRISSRIVPSIIDVVRTCIIHSQNARQLTALHAKDVNGVTPHLLHKAIKFLSSPAVVSDPHAASLAWSFISLVASDNNPPAIRSCVIRVLPGMCAGNKRLRSRIHEIVRKSLTSRNPLIRTAAMSTLSDLAKQDLVRDVQEIVGWIQLGLKDDEPAVSYFALLSLKYLVSNDVLVFDLVTRVLEKRFGTNLSDSKSVLSALGNDLLLEGFVLLLAEAGFEEDGDDEDKEDREGLRVSPQSAKAVSLLVELSLSHGPDQLMSGVRVQTAILRSLACYNAQLLGLDAESIRSCSEADTSEDRSEQFALRKRYGDIKQIALAGLQLATKLIAVAENCRVDEDNDVVDSVTSILGTLLLFEEDVYGSSLYRTAASEKISKIRSDSRARISTAALSSLPDYTKILQMYDDEPNASNATAVMSAMPSNIEDNSSTDLILSRLSELVADVACDRFSEPHLNAIQLRALMDCMKKLWSGLSGYGHEQQDKFSGVIEELESWIDRVGEYAYIAISMFLLGVDESNELPPDLADRVTKIQNSMMKGTFMFETEEVNLLCLCLVAAKMSNSAEERVTEAIDRLEKFLEGPNKSDNQIPFGIVFGMSVLVSNLIQDGKHLNSSDASDIWRRKQARRIISIHLLSINNCLTLPNSTISSLACCVEDGRFVPKLSDSCAQMEELFVNEKSLHIIRGLMIGLGLSFSTLAALDVNLSTCILSVLEKLPWNSGKAFALNVAYKSHVKIGVLDRGHLSNVVTGLIEHLADDDDPCLGHVLYVVANLCQLLPAEEIDNTVDIVKKTMQDYMRGRGSSDGKQMAILSAVSLIGEIKGLSSHCGNGGIHGYIKKDVVISIAKFLSGVTISDGEDSRTKSAATVGLGLMSGMKDSDKKAKQKARENSENDPRVNFAALLQAKDDTMLFSIFTEINESHATLTATNLGEVTRKAAAEKLCILFKTLKTLPLPGNSGGRLIEVMLNDCHEEETELKSACMELLVSQLESRRRIGFDGRGFLDVYLRLSKMSSEGLRKLVGVDNVPIMMTALPNVITQLPTSSGEEVVVNLWKTCLFDLADLLNAQSAIEFFVGLKSILMSSGATEKKSVISPAVLRSAQKLVTSNFFHDMCRYAGPFQKNYTLTSDAETLWIAYAECISQVSDLTSIGESDVSDDNLFGMSTCSTMLRNISRVRQKVEMYIACHPYDSNLRLMLTSLVAMGPQCSSISELKDSILRIFDLMLVKGIDTMCLEVLAIEVIFSWRSLDLSLDFLEMPLLHVSTLCSFLLTRDLSFKIQAWPSEWILKFFDLCLVDLPSMLVFLCGQCKISEDVANRTSRILSAVAQQNGSGLAMEGQFHHKSRALACLRSIAQLLNEGEP
eukprot:CCRYP_018763-RA/>CCRYP_018763-RA protein AED:0.01 eAED:0.01 QI:89/1/1/1/0/0/2/372/2023